MVDKKMDDGRNTSATGSDMTSNIIIASKAISIVVILIIICVLNSLVSYTIHKKSHLLQNHTGNRYIFSMALSNCIYGAVVLPLNFVSCVLGDWVFGIVVCNLAGFVTMTIFAGSMLSIVVITMDRYFAILEPMVYQSKLTCRRTKEIIVIIWMISLVAGLPPLFGWSRFTWLQSTSNCLVQWDSHPSYTYTFTTVFLFLPLCVMCYCYVKILRVARLSTRRTSNGNTVSGYDPSQRRRSRRTSLLVNIRMNSPTKAIKTVLVTVSAFLLTVGPLSVMMLYQAVLGAESVPIPVTVASTWLFFCSFIANSCIYAVWNKSIRGELLGYFCTRCLDDYDDTPLFQPGVRKGSKTMSISESVSDTGSKSRNGSLTGGLDSANDDSGTGFTSTEESEDKDLLNLAETLIAKNARRKRRGSPVSFAPMPPSYRRSSIQMSSLPVVAEVHLPGSTGDDGEEDVGNSPSATPNGRT